MQSSKSDGIAIQLFVTKYIYSRRSVRARRVIFYLGIFVQLAVFFCYENRSPREPSLFNAFSLSSPGISLLSSRIFARYIESKEEGKGGERGKIFIERNKKKTGRSRNHKVPQP